jgi:HK97 family phage major capsid protein
MLSASAGDQLMTERNQSAGLDEVVQAVRQLDTSIEVRMRELDSYKVQQREIADRLLSLEQKQGAPRGDTRGDMPAGGKADFLLDPKTGRRLPVLTKADNAASIGRKLAEMRGRATPAGDDLSPGDREASFRDFLCAVANMKSTEWGRKALSINVGSAGGFDVPTVLLPGLLDALFASSSLLQAGVRIVPFSGGAKEFQIAAVNTLPTASWRSESGAVAESDPAFRQVVVTPRSLSFRFRASRELLQDSRNLDNATMQRIAAQAIAVAQDLAGLRGSGTGPTPRGLLNQVGITTVTNGANGAALSNIRYANLLSAYQNIITANAGMPTAAIMAPRTLVGFGGLTATDNQPLQRPQLLQPINMLASSQIPVNLTTGTSTDTSEIYCGDFSRAFWAIREDVNIMASPDTAAGTGEVEFFVHARCDFVVEYVQAFNVITGVRPG